VILHQTPGLGFNFEETAVTRRSLIQGRQGPWLVLE